MTSIIGGAISRLFRVQDLDTLCEDLATTDIAVFTVVVNDKRVPAEFAGAPEGTYVFLVADEGFWPAEVDEHDGDDTVAQDKEYGAFLNIIQRNLLEGELAIFEEVSLMKTSVQAMVMSVDYTNRQTLHTLQDLIFSLHGFDYPYRNIEKANPINRLRPDDILTEDRKPVL